MARKVRSKRERAAHEKAAGAADVAAGLGTGRPQPDAPAPESEPATPVAGPGSATAELDFTDIWYPIQVKQKEKVGRPVSAARHQPETVSCDTKRTP